jgi:hypothetical protein
MRPLEQGKINCFLEYMNNFCTTEGWAEYHGLAHKSAKKLLTKGRALHYDSSMQPVPTLSA